MAWIAPASLEDIECGSHYWDCCSSWLVFPDASAAATHRLRLLPLSSFLRAQLPSARMAVSRRVRTCRAALSQRRAGAIRRSADRSVVEEGATRGNMAIAVQPESVRRFTIKGN